MVALADIALQPPDALVTLGGIAQRQNISLPYLEQLFVKLRRAELVESVRGLGLDPKVTSQLAAMLRALSGHYDQAARAAASL